MYRIQLKAANNTQRALKASNLLRLFEQCDEMVECFELLEAMHVLWTDGALPDGSSGGHQQLLVVRLTDELVERIQPAVLAYQVTCLLLLRALTTVSKQLTYTHLHD